MKSTNAAAIWPTGFDVSNGNENDCQTPNTNCFDEAAQIGGDATNHLDVDVQLIGAQEHGRAELEAGRGLARAHWLRHAAGRVRPDRDVLRRDRHDRLDRGLDPVPELSARGRYRVRATASAIATSVTNVKLRGASVRPSPTATSSESCSPVSGSIRWIPRRSST